MYAVCRSSAGSIIPVFFPLVVAEQPDDGITRVALRQELVADLLRYPRAEPRHSRAVMITIEPESDEISRLIGGVLPRVSFYICNVLTNYLPSRFKPDLLDRSK